LRGEPRIVQSQESALGDVLNLEVGSSAVPPMARL
jgi:hypothetical protein